MTACCKIVEFVTPRSRRRDACWCSLKAAVAVRVCWCVFPLDEQSGWLCRPGRSALARIGTVIYVKYLVRRGQKTCKLIVCEVDGVVDATGNERCAAGLDEGSRISR
jgi:hypothetical protein